ncbi:hypothetical protein [Candidatus Palauibacter sp.]|uniref:hypothetical protein n=1 Tax=Candidatus Palauibacter sp. TaxID=3101350 RepID=UPI003B58DB4E
MREKAAQVAQTGIGLADLQAELKEMAGRSWIDVGQVDAFISNGVADALERALEDQLLSSRELRSLNAYCEHFGIPPSFRCSQRVRKAVLLAGILEHGVIPKPDDGSVLPFNLMKSESLLWLFEGVEYVTEVTHKQYVAGSQGMSFRVARGVYYRVGGTRGRNVSTTAMETVDSGLMAVTTKHLYFKGGGIRGKSFRIRLNRIVSFEPYEDGVGLMRDTQRAKSEAFKTDDGLFTTNLLRVAAAAMDEDGIRQEDHTLDEIVQSGFALTADDEFLLLEGDI